MLRPKLIAGFLLLIPVVASAAAGNLSTRFDAANRLYEIGSYTESAQAYAEIIQSGHTSAAIYFNLGNAYLKADQIGAAIAAYHHARLLNPRDPDIRKNLEHALARLPESEATLLQTYAPVRFGLTLGQWTLLGSVAFWIFFALLAIREWKPDLASRLRGPIYTSGILMLVLLVTVGWIAFARFGHRLGIVTQSDTVVRYGPLSESESRYTLSDGFVVRIIDQKGDWLKVSHAKHPPGWVKQSRLTKLRSG